MKTSEKDQRFLDEAIRALSKIESRDCSDEVFETIQAVIEDLNEVAGA